VQLLIEDGTLTRSRHGKMGLISNLKAYMDHAERVVMTEGRGGPATLSASRSRLTRFKADAATIDLRELNNALISRNEVEIAWNILGQRIRSHLSRLPAQLAARLASISSIVEVQEIVGDEIRSALDKLVSEPFEARVNGHGPESGVD
jgi:phage terminase Nu1 subunit (DNA packaging protein)